MIFFSHPRHHSNKLTEPGIQEGYNTIQLKPCPRKFWACFLPSVLAFYVTKTTCSVTQSSVHEAAIMEWQPLMSTMFPPGPYMGIFPQVPWGLTWVYFHKFPGALHGYISTFPGAIYGYIFPCSTGPCIGYISPCSLGPYMGTSSLVPRCLTWAHFPWSLQSHIWVYSLPLSPFPPPHLTSTCNMYSPCSPRIWSSDPIIHISSVYALYSHIH